LKGVLRITENFNFGILSIYCPPISAMMKT
jgi:hypothetical protein